MTITLDSEQDRAWLLVCLDHYLADWRTYIRELRDSGRPTQAHMEEARLRYLESLRNEIAGVTP